MDKQRQKLYQDLAKMIGNTPLVEVHDVGLQNGCRLFAKVELFNPTSNHHDRQYWQLFYDAESKGELTPGASVVEVTSGCAGASFAWFARKLGYKATVIIPRELPGNRIKMITDQECELFINPEGYIPGCVRKLRRMLVKNRSMFCMNHSRMDASSESLKGIATEALSARPSLNTYIAMMGSGSSVLGPGSVFASRGKEVVAWEPAQSGYAYSMIRQDYEERFGFAPGTFPHNVWGGSFNGLSFPHIAQATGLLSRDVMLLRSGSFPHSDKNGVEIPSWDHMRSCWPIGHSSLGNIAAAVEYSKTAKDKEILTVFYDPATNY